MTVMVMMAIEDNGDDGKASITEHVTNDDADDD